MKSKKEIAIQFLELAAFGKVDEAYEKFVAPNFVHHNQYCPGDRTSLLSAMKESAMSMPNKMFSVKMAIAEGEQVVTYSHVSKEKAEIAVTHIFRFEGNLIAEMWDIGQVISTDSPNKNGMF